MSQKHLCNNRRKRIYSMIMNCAAPVLTMIFLAGSVCWAAELQYGKPVVYDKDPEAAMVFSSKGLVNGINGYAEIGLPVSDAVTVGTANSGAELVEACGVYIDDEFIGAVVDKDSIETQLEAILDEYRDDENIIEADYAVQPDLKQGVYRSEALVDESDMKDFLTGEKNVVSEYTAEEEDTAEKIAEDFDMSIDEVKELNPEIEKIEDGESIKIKETVSVLPVKYICEEQEEEIIELETYEYNENSELVSEGIRGKKLSTYEVTYVDGTEISRKLKGSETVELPSAVDHAEETDADGIDTEKTEELYTESVPETEDIFSGEFIWPVNGGYISDPFMSDRNHKGMDIAAPAGTDIYAADGGTVIEAGWNDGGYGNFVMIDHGNGYITLYGHASEVYVSSGDTVSQGDLIAAVGTTGDSTGNHCHFEVRFDGGFLNPDDFI